MKELRKITIGVSFLLALFLVAVFVDEARPVCTFLVVFSCISALILYTLYFPLSLNHFSPSLTGVIHPSEKFYFAQAGKLPSESLLKGNSTFAERTFLQATLFVGLVASLVLFIVFKVTSNSERADDLSYICLFLFVLFYSLVLTFIVTKSWRYRSVGYNALHILCAGLVLFINGSEISENGADPDVITNDDLIGFTIAVVLSAISTIAFTLAYLGELLDGQSKALFDDEADETLYNKEIDGQGTESFTFAFVICRSVGLLLLDASMLSSITGFLVEVSTSLQEIDVLLNDTIPCSANEDSFLSILAFCLLILVHLILLTVTQSALRTMRKRAFLKIYFGLKMSSRRIQGFAKFSLSYFAELHINLVVYLLFPVVLFTAYFTLTNEDGFEQGLECILGIDCELVVAVIPATTFICLIIMKIMGSTKYALEYRFFMKNFDFNKTWVSFLPKMIISIYFVIAVFSPFEGVVNIRNVCFLQEVAIAYVASLLITAWIRLICEKWESVNTNLVTVRNRQFLPVERIHYNPLTISSVVDKVMENYQTHPRRLDELRCRILLNKLRVMVGHLTLYKGYPEVSTGPLVSILTLFDLLCIGLNLNHKPEEMNETWNEIGNNAVDVLARCLEAFLTNDICIRGTYRVLSSLKYSAVMKAKIEQMFHLVFETAVERNVSLPEVTDVSSTTYKAYQKTIQLIKLNTFYAVNIDFLFSHSIVDVDDLLTLRHLTDRSTVLVASSSIALQNFSKILLELQLPDFTVGSLNFRRPYKNLTELILIGSEKLPYGSSRDQTQEEFRISDDEGLAISCMINLRVVNLANQDLTSNGIAEWYRLKKLTHLYLANNIIDTEGVRVIRNLPLEALDLTGNPVDLEGLSIVAQMKDLRLLLIPKTEGVADEGRVDFAGSPRCNCVELTDFFGVNSNKLRYLDISNWEVGALGFATFVAGSKHLLVLKASGNLLSGKCWKFLAPNVQLFSLEIGNNVVLGQGKVTVLRKFKKLETLDVERTGLGARGLKACAPLPRLKVVNFAVNNLDTNSMRYFAQNSKSKASLVEINLAMNGLSDEALDELGLFTNVETLDMSSNLIGTQSVRKLVRSRRDHPEEVLANLKHLSLSGNIIDSQLKDELVDTGIREVELEPLSTEIDPNSLEAPPKRSTRLSRKTDRFSYKSYQSVEPSEL